MMRRRRNLIRVFTLAKGALFISTYYRAPMISKAHKNAFYKGVKFCTQADDKYQSRKIRRGECGGMI
jgi:hypothetical protein